MVDIVVEQVLHGRRQFVVWIVPLSGVTNETLIVCYMCHARLPPQCSRSEHSYKLLVTSYEYKFCVAKFVTSNSQLLTLNYALRAYWGGRKERMTPGQHDPWYLGLHTWYNGWDNGSRRSNPEPILKPILSSDWGLQLALMKSESLVIAGQLYRGEYVLKSCTHRPSSQGSRGYPKSVHCMA